MQAMCSGFPRGSPGAEMTVSLSTSYTIELQAVVENSSTYLRLVPFEELNPNRAVELSAWKYNRVGCHASSA